jgi:hypothetical protein
MTLFSRDKLPRGEGFVEGELADSPAFRVQPPLARPKKYGFSKVLLSSHQPAFKVRPAAR